MKTILGLQQQQEGLRRLALIIHASLVEEKNRANISEAWPLPFDKEHSNETTRLQQRIKYYQEQKEKLLQDGR